MSSQPDPLFADLDADELDALVAAPRHSEDGDECGAEAILAECSDATRAKFARVIEQHEREGAH